MSKKWLVVIGAAALAGLLLAGMAGLALAQGPQPGQGTPGPGFGWGCGGYGAYGMMGSGSRWDMHQTMWEAAAKALGLTTDQLAAEFQAGKTLSQVAQEHNVEMATLQKALTDAQKAALDKAVADGWLTQKQADLMLDHMDDMWQAFGDSGFGPGGWMMGPGWGPGWGPGRGMMGWGRGMMGWGYQTPPSQ